MELDGRIIVLLCQCHCHHWPQAHAHDHPPCDHPQTRTKKPELEIKRNASCAQASCLHDAKSYTPHFFPYEGGGRAGSCCRVLHCSGLLGPHPPSHLGSQGDQWGALAWPSRKTLACQALGFGSARRVSWLGHNPQRHPWSSPCY